MKNTKYLSILLSFIMLFFISITSIPTTILAAEGDTITLNAEANNSGNYVSLNWTPSNTSEKYHYTIHSKRANEVEFQSIPAKADVKVLNIYPGKDENGNPVGDDLKDWMENPNEEDANGYGKGLISVDKVDIDDFNKNPDSYLKDSYKNWKYDVIMFGSYDSYGGKDIDESAAELVEDYISTGRGVLFGHDTIKSYPPERCFSKHFIKYLNMRLDLDYWNGGKEHGDGEEVKICKKGLLTNYPWYIGEIGSKLNIPRTHNVDQICNGDIWLKFTNLDDNAECNSYLVSWNNTAMIQTGHSNGEATTDEQKILANTLFYLAQVTEDTSWKDHKGQDLAAPDKPNITNVTKNTSENKTTISLNPSKDNGSTYEYYVEGIGRNDSETIKSETKSSTITSGIKGYSIVVDQNENTIPDGSITTTSTNYILDKVYDSDFYVHVAAVDNAGNISEVSTFKYSYPVLKLTANTTELVKDAVTITANASCEGNSIVKIITPDGKEVSGDKAEYTVDVNGTYTFKAIDDKGDEVTEKIDVTNIKPDIIINVEPNINKTHLKEDFVVDLTINNINSIFATEVRIKYDSSKLSFLGFDTIDGVDMVNNDVSDGEITLVLASLGLDNVLESTTMLKMNFTGIAPGDALIDVVKADVADGDFMEKTLRDAECGETTINIVNRELTSVNSDDKVFTLLDLSIIAKHYGEDPEALLLTGIDADLNLDGKIDKADYQKCYQLMLKNPNRKF